MKPVQQTKTGKGGNCFSACIASLLEMETDTVPHFCLTPNWREATNLWLSSRGLFYMDIRLPGDMRDELVCFWGYHVISGPSPRRKGINHAVIGFKGEIFFDPHPDGGGLAGGTDFWEYGFLIDKRTL